MSAVHKQIAAGAFHALSSHEQQLWATGYDALEASSEYPDIFADRSMPQTKKDKIDPDADRYLWPDPPQTPWYEKILHLTEDEAQTGMAPLRWMYFVEYYLRHTVECLRRADFISAAKYAGVYSHAIGDTIEPIHAVNPRIVDLVVPPPREFLGLELHANVEGLKAPVDIAGYQPKLLGVSIPQAAMAGYQGLWHGKQIGAAQVVPITQALYAGDRQRATTLSQIAQNESARLFADFMHTAAILAKEQVTTQSQPLDLCDYPYASADIEMLYRYRPIVDASLIPYSGGQSHPLSLPNSKGTGITQVHGLGVLPFLGPPHTSKTVRKAEIEYCLIPDAYTHFEATVGINPLFEQSMGRAIFRVYGDDQLLFESPELERTNTSVPLSIPLKGIRWLRLTMQYTTSVDAETVARLHCAWALHGVWANPRLTSHSASAH